MNENIPDYRAMAKTAQDLGYTNRELVAKRLLRKIMRDESYLKRREQRGTHTSHDDPEVEYHLGEKMKQPAKRNHSGGYFSYPTLEMGENYLASCLASMPFHEEVVTPQLALLEVEIWGKCIDYGHKMCSTYLLPLRVLEVRDIAN